MVFTKAEDALFSVFLSLPLFAESAIESQNLDWFFQSWPRLPYCHVWFTHFIHISTLYSTKGSQKAMQSAATWASKFP